MKPAGEACYTCPGRNAKCVPTEFAPGTSKLTLIGEAPGNTELAEGRPFSPNGRSGRMLARGLATLGLTREQVTLTNAVLCEVSPAHWREARKACQARLLQEIAKANASVVVPVGAHALTSALSLPNRAKITEWRGSITKRGNVYYMPTVHPAFVMRAKQWGPVLEADFARIGRVLEAGWEAPEDRPGVNIVVARHVREVERYLETLSLDVGIDVETVGLGPTHTDLVCLAIADTRLSVVIPYTKELNGKGRYWGKAWRRVRAAINRCLAKRVAITHNGFAFDHIVLRRYGIKLIAVEDTLCMAHAAHSHMRKALNVTAQRYIDVPPWKEYDHAKDMPSMWVYNGRDSLYAAMVAKPLAKAVRDADQWDIYQQDKRTGELCRDMQITGFKVDKGRAEAMAERLAAREREIEARCSEALGKTINLLSPTQLREAFFGKGGLGAYVCYRSEKTGQPSLGVDVMRAYAAGPNEKLAAFATDVLAYRRCRKVRISNLTNPLKMLDASNRIHPTWKNTGAVSGRFSSADPNLMNLPTIANDPTIDHTCGSSSCKALSGGKCKCDCDRCAGVRSIYIARPGWVIAAFDRAQLEMRVAAYDSQDPVMIAACESTDLHSANAAVIFGKAFTMGDDWEKLSKAELKSWLDHPQRFTFRQLAKSAGFAVCYMAQAFTVYERIIAMGVPVTLRQVEGMLRKMRTKFRKYYDWQAERFEEITETHYVYEHVTGRRRWLGDEPSPTEAANFPIQGGAAGLMNLQLPDVVRAARALRLPAFPIAQVHDNGTFEVRREALEDFQGEANRVLDTPIMLGGAPRVFPSDWKVSERWA